ncbi:MAG: aminotransferase class III-fold pyridoxal phosphate-dependent enzyme [Oscillospiraceae bacterium]|jgi:taurine--2-oxoglutarate transaminase|nr:aminotransferase class III-fold pyridoxal phosphate-dependent enzyme [Oscillospiraceae bacterium]
MPSLTKEEVLALDKQYNQHPWLTGTVEPLAIARAEGIYFWDYDGKRYFDMSCQLTCSNIGFGNEAVNNAIKAQLDRFAYVAPAHAFEAKSVLAKKLVELAGGGMAKVFFTCGGSDANEAALNMARTVTGRAKVLSRYRSYHGSTLGSGNISGDPRRFSLEQPAANGFLKFFDPYVYRSDRAFESDAAASAYYLGLLESQIQYEGTDQIAAVFVESVTGANGVIVPPDGYLQGLRELCTRYGILLVCDEVMAGFGRTGKAFGFQHWGVEPDIISFAKGVTCGYVQLGGIIISRQIADFYKDHLFQFGLTYSGHALACAAGVACLELYERENLFERVASLGKVLGELLEEQKVKHACVGDVRYIGLFSALELVKSKETKEPLVPYAKDAEGVMKRIFGLLRERGFSTYGRENNINVTPPLTITEQELREAFVILDEVLTIVDKTFI